MCAPPLSRYSSSRSVMGSFKQSQGATSQCSLGYSLHIACFSSSSLSLSSPSSPSFSRHGPSIREKCSTLPPSQWFHSVLHPSRRSQQIPTMVCFFLFCTAGAGSTCSGVVVVCMVKRIPILQICHAVAVLKQRLVSFQHVHNFSL